MNEKECKAAGFYFGVSNLGLSPTVPSEMIERYGSDWDRIADEYDFELQGYAESDEMYEGMLNEVDYWVKTMDSEDEYFVKEWEKKKIAA
jgi:hypothetical protein